MRNLGWLVRRSLHLDVALMAVPGITLRSKLRFIAMKYWCIVRDLVVHGQEKPKRGEAFDGPFYYNDEFATGLLQSIYVHDYRLKKHVPEGGIIVDVGANIGQFCRFAEHYLGARTVLSFEPLSEPFSALELNNRGFAFKYAIGSRVEKNNNVSI